MSVTMKKKRKPMMDLTSHLQSKTTRQFASRFDVALAEIPEDIEFFGGKVPGHALTCATVLHLLEMDHEERNQFLRAYLKKYEDIVRDPDAFEGQDRAAEEPDVIERLPGGGRRMATNVDPEPAARPAPKKASTRKGQTGS